MLSGSDRHAAAADVGGGFRRIDCAPGQIENEGQADRGQDRPGDVRWTASMRGSRRAHGVLDLGRAGSPKQQRAKDGELGDNAARAGNPEQCGTNGHSGEPVHHWPSIRPREIEVSSTQKGVRRRRSIQPFHQRIATLTPI